MPVPQYLPEISVGGVVTVLVVREFLRFIKDSKNGKANNNATKAEKVVLAAELLVQKDVCTERHKRIDEGLSRIESAVVKTQDTVEDLSHRVITLMGQSKGGGRSETT